jgi:hypothetical protein
MNGSEIGILTNSQASSIPVDVLEPGSIPDLLLFAVTY